MAVSKGFSLYLPLNPLPAAGGPKGDFFASLQRLLLIVKEQLKILI
jgi:hypothetical protein